MSAQRQKPIDFAAEGLRLALSVDRNLRNPGSIKKGAAMKFASIKPHELAVVKDDTWIAVGQPLARQGALPADFSMLDLIEKYESLKSSLTEALHKGDAKRIDAKLLKPPVEKPSKIWAAAGNYKR